LLDLGGECYNASDPTGFRGTITISKDGEACINWTDSKL